MDGSPCSFAAAASGLLCMILGLANEAAACASSVRWVPSQEKRKERAALKTLRTSRWCVGAVPGVGWEILVAPLKLTSWHDEHERVLSSDSRASLKSCSPSLSLAGSAAGGCGIGVM